MADPSAALEEANRRLRVSWTVRRALLARLRSANRRLNAAEAQIKLLRRRLSKIT